MEFKYLVETYDKSLSEIAQDQERIAFGLELSKKGKFGWELINIKELPGGAGLILIFKVETAQA
ncbi:MAG: hypothetical protein KKF12_04720 [Proteobacteria bacterium]|nr:hypothetical protein [Desulfobacula sp.]MBU4130103.1 hypothetical protein [Pseudomonadota bacterium]